MKQRKPIFQRKRKAVYIDGFQEKVVVDPEVGLTATLAERLMAKRNAKHVEDKLVKKEQSTLHADQLHQHAEPQEKESHGEKQKNHMI